MITNKKKIPGSKKDDIEEKNEKSDESDEWFRFGLNPIITFNP